MVGQILDCLRYLQPSTVSITCSQLVSYGRLQQVLDLAGRVWGISQVSKMYNLPDVWWGQILVETLRQVEGLGWFPIDWGTIDGLFYQSRILISCPARREEQQLIENKLALFIKYVPILLFGFDDQTIETFPPIELLRGLLSCEHHLLNISLSTKRHAGVHCLLVQEGWGDQERAWAWVRLENIEHDPLRYPEPMRLLPILGRWAVGHTGNTLLDISPILDDYALSPFYIDSVSIRIIEEHGESHWFTWNNIEHALAAWQEAWLAQTSLRRVMDWYEREPERLVRLTRFLAKGEGQHELNW